MARIPRSQFRDYRVFHVTAKGAGGTNVFLDDSDRERFMLLLGRVTDRFGWQTHAWCLMGTHFHLLIEAPLDRLSAGMQRLAGIYAQEFNRRWARKGHLYEERFTSWVIRDGDHYRNAFEYILNNPVRAGLCADRQDWPWSWPRFERQARTDRPWPYEPCPGDCPPDTAGPDEAVRTT